MTQPSDKTEQPEKQKLTLKEKIEQEQTLRVIEPKAQDVQAFPLSTTDGESTLSSRLTNSTNRLDSEKKKSAKEDNKYSLPDLIKTSKNDAPVDAASPPSAGAIPVHAGFLWRVLAHFVDDTLFGWLCTALILVLGAGCALFFHFSPRIIGPNTDGIFLAVLAVIAIIVFVISCLATGWLYFAGLESSAMEATPGKRMLGFRVCDESGKRLSPWHSTVRLFVQPALLIATFITFMLAATFLPQLNSPIATGISMAGIVVLFIAGLFANAVLLNKKKQTLVDIISKRVVLKRDLLKSGDPKLLPLEKKLLVAVTSLIPIFLIEIFFLWVCNVDFASFTNGAMGTRVLNNSGHVLIANENLAAGSILDLKKCKKEVMPILLTPPWAIDSSTQLGRALVTSDVTAGSIVSYGHVLANTRGIGNILSIEPVKDDNFFVSKCVAGPVPDSTMPKWLNSSPADDLKRDSRSIQALLTSSSSFNQKKQFDKALVASNQAIQKMIELGKKANAEDDNKTAKLFQRMNSPLVNSQGRFLTKDISQLPDWITALTTDLLVQRSIARQGLHQTKEATIDGINSTRLLNSLHEDFVATRTSELSGLSSDGSSPANIDDATTATDPKSSTTTDPDEKAASSDKTSTSEATSDPENTTDEPVLDEQSARYVKMLGDADEARYRAIVEHIKRLIPNGGLE